VHHCFIFDIIHFTGYGVIAEKPHVGQLGRNFPCTKNEWHLLWWPRWALSPCKVWGRSYNMRRL